MGDYKSTLIRALFDSTNFQDTLNYLPSKNALKSIKDYLKLEKLMLTFSYDPNAEDILKLLEYEPKPEEFTNEEDYMQAKRKFNIIKNMINIAGKNTSKINVADLEEILHIREYYTSLIAYANSIKGWRISLLTTERQQYEALMKGRGSRNLLNMMMMKEE